VAIIDFFDRGWRQGPDEIAYVMGDRSWTYDEAGRLSCRVARRLLAAGLPRETKAAVLSPNDPLAWIVVLGIWRAGLTWVPLGLRPPGEMRQLLEAFDCEVLFFHSSLADVVGEIKADLPQVREYVFFGDEGAAADGTPLEGWLAGQPDTRPDVRYEMDDVVAISSTGGTTGLPKGVMNTHRSFAATFAHLMLAFFYPSDVRPVNLVAAPLTHASGVLTMPVTARGGKVVAVERPETGLLLDAIEQHRVTDVFLPPTVIYRLLDVPDIAERDFSSLRYMLYSAAPMSTEKLRRALEVFGPVMMECYGQVEAFAGISYMRPEEHFAGGEVVGDDRLASCGRPYPLITLEIRDEDDRPVPPGASGEICVRGDLVMKGYYKAPERTGETIIDGWLHTGDIGHLDADGYLFVTDRKKDMIISGGLNIYPSEIEQVIWSHPAVEDCAVIGVPDDEWGEAVKAVAELVPGADASAEELIALCKERLGGVRAPKSVDFVESLPRSANGKVLKREVRDPYWMGLARRV
jgi:acyl-CoA synthetase (AMP-forming)/AMP-acid ligase II